MNDPKFLANLLHTIICKKQHVDITDKVINGNDVCLYYVEDILDVAWDQPVHQKWLKKANLLITLAKQIAEADQNDIEIDQTISTLISSLIFILRKISELEQASYSFYKFCLQLIHDEITTQI